jgi:hypothetical protein
MLDALRPVLWELGNERSLAASGVGESGSMSGAGIDKALIVAVPSGKPVVARSFDSAVSLSGCTSLFILLTSFMPNSAGSVLK